MELGIEGRVALIAGGTSGLGAAVAASLLAEGARVSVCGRSSQRVDQQIARLRRDHGKERVDGAVVDVTDADAVRNWVTRVAGRWGGIDIVVANAGGPPGGHATEHPLEAYRQAIETNLLGSVCLVDAALHSMRERGWGRVLFITSMSVKQPVEGLALSNTARPGLLGYARSLVQELGAANITVNVLAPGITRTARLDELVGPDPADVEALAADVPLGRLGTPEEFAAAATFLASEPAGYITGVVLPVDGGVIRSLY